MAAYQDYVDEYIPLDCQWKLDKVLDWNNDAEEDLISIAYYLTNWEVKLSGPLKITPEEKEAIQEEKDPELRRREVLRKWKARNRLKATYRLLLDKCVEANHDRPAEKICRLVARDPPDRPGNGYASAARLDSAAQNGQVNEQASHVQPPVSPVAPGSAVSTPQLPIRIDAAKATAEEHGSTVESDGANNLQYEACNRGTHTPLLKFHDSDKKITNVPPKELRQLPQDLGYYKMSAPRHGVALIINNKHFKQHKQRKGTERDEYNLIQTCKYLGYRPVVCSNLTAEEMLETFGDLDAVLRDSDKKAKVSVEHDSFICCILSHGNRGSIITSDGVSVNREEIEKKAGESTILNSKPKIFFIQACQGKEYGTEPVQRLEADDSGSKRSDFYICLATAIGDKSYRDIHTGSWFITEVCRVLCEFATCESFDSEFQLRLNENVANNETYRYCDDKEKKYAQQPTCSNQLQKHVHFFDMSY